MCLPRSSLHFCRSSPWSVVSGACISGLRECSTGSEVSGTSGIEGVGWLFYPFDFLWVVPVCIFPISAAEKSYWYSSAFLTFFHSSFSTFSSEGHFWDTNLRDLWIPMDCQYEHTLNAIDISILLTFLILGRWGRENSAIMKQVLMVLSMISKKHENCSLRVTTTPTECFRMSNLPGWWCTT